ncbi:hypothetical protein MARCHEWKA_04850 [Brevundimonas phage vB_BpoS-Marchewka]|uniref:Uncharacterized protein n=1 Tax=Brevundimonas phage vB_BpoS-Marchewka TaxID=2948604 RepID=A0A9E7N5N0_9CAUD|nr:hypothetical protein MARCHEWKA_04850 [Brevundimonas phage vB_BpoS-Marchewka]
MAALNEFLSALVSATEDAFRLIYGDVTAEITTPESLEAAVAAAGAEPLYLDPVTANGDVPFLYSYTENAQPDQWQDDVVKPTAVLFKDGLLICAYALDAAVQVTPEVTAIADAMAGYLTDPVPTPGANGWEVVHLDPEHYVTFAQLAEVYVEDAPPAPEILIDTPAVQTEGYALPWEEEDHGALNDAKLLSPFQLDDPRYAQEMTVSIGANRESVKWTPKAMTVWTFVDMLSRHREDKKKDGLAFVLAEIVGNQRRKAAVKACYGVGLDIDVGVSGAVIDEALVKLGKLAVRYTTHSHAKTSTKMLKDRIAKWCKKHDIAEGVTQQSIERFLREEPTMRWDESIIKTVEYVDDVHDPEGFMVQLDHIPMPKHRIVLPLTEPFVPTAVAKTHDEGMKMWGEVCHALAKALGDLPLDRSAVDPSRLFYFPRHAANRPFEARIVGGDLLDWKSLELAQGGADDAPTGDALLDLVLNEVKATDKSKPKSKSTTEEGRDLGRWSIKAAGGFQIVDLIKDHADDRIRTNGAHKIDIECPFDEDHSDPGNPEDKGCFAVNAGDGPSEIFTIKCQHDSCSQRTNLDFLGKMLKDDWFDRDTIDDPTYNALLEEGSEGLSPEGEKIKVEDDAREVYEKLVDGLTEDSSEEDVDDCLRAVIEANLPTRRSIQIEAKIRKALKLSQPNVTKLLKSARAEISRAKNEKGSIKDPKGREVFEYESSYNFDEAFDACFRTLTMTNKKDKEPTFSCVQTDPVRLNRNAKTGRISFDVLNEAAMRSEMNKRMTFMRRSEKGDGTREAIPKEVGEYVYQQCYNELPQSPEIIYTPLFTADGDLVMTPGYKADLNILMANINFTVAVPQSPTWAEVEEAVAFLREEVLIDFPFLDYDTNGTERRDPSEANALAMIITPFMRRMINGCTPVFFVSKPTPGTGGTLLGKLPMLLFDGQESAPMRYTQNEEEMQKSLLSAIIETRSHLFFDDVKEFNNRALLQSITAQEIGGRMLGKTANISRPNLFNWIGTGNNPIVLSEMERRIVWVRLNGKTVDIQTRVFRHKDFTDFLNSNRSKIVGYILTMIQYWIDLEKPMFEERKRASFEDWSRKVGGVLQACGIEGFLDNRASAIADMDETAIRAFVKEWIKKYGFNKVLTGDLFNHAYGMEMDIIEGNNDDQKKRMFQKKMHNLDGRAFRIDNLDYLVRSGLSEEGDPMFFLQRVEQYLEEQPQPDPLAA